MGHVVVVGLALIGDERTVAEQLVDAPPRGDAPLAGAAGQGDQRLDERTQVFGLLHRRGDAPVLNQALGQIALHRLVMGGRPIQFP
jgi:hypothetical protein